MERDTAGVIGRLAGRFPVSNQMFVFTRINGALRRLVVKVHAICIYESKNA